MDRHGSNLSLLCRVRTRLYALPLSQIVETMRPLPVEPVAGTYRFISGLSIIRGNPIPVVDIAFSSGRADSGTDRFVTMIVGGRTIALAVDEVLGIRAIDDASLQTLPPLLQTLEDDVIQAMGTLDAELLLVLSETRLVPEDFWKEIEAR